jgi:hypothetical protein
VDTIFDLLPEPYATWARIIAQVSFLASLAAIPIKKALGEPKPGADPRWKQLAFFCMHFVDVVAANTETIRAKTKKAKASIPPPAAAAGLVLLLCFLPATEACAATNQPLRTEALAADALGELLDDAEQVISERMHVIEQSAVALAPTKEESIAAFTQAKAKDAPLAAAYEAARAAHLAYVQALSKASQAGQDHIPPDVSAMVAAAWAALSQAARELGVHLPQAPPSLADLLGGAP